MNDPRTEVIKQFVAILDSAHELRRAARLHGLDGAHADLKAALAKMDARADRLGAFLKDQAKPFPEDLCKLIQVLNQ